VIQDRGMFDRFEREMKKREQADYLKNLDIFEGMLEEARYLGVLPLKNPLDGIEIDIMVARVVNSV